MENSIAQTPCGIIDGGLFCAVTVVAKACYYRGQAYAPGFKGRRVGRRERISRTNEYLRIATNHRLLTDALEPAEWVGKCAEKSWDLFLWSNVEKRQMRSLYYLDFPSQFWLSLISKFSDKPSVQIYQVHGDRAYGRAILSSETDYQNLKKGGKTTWHLKRKYLRKLFCFRFLT
jgi:hypothetical protein